MSALPVQNHVMDGDASIKDVARRLVLLRQWAGYENQKAFAVATGLTASELNHYETARRMPSLTAANKIKLRWRVTLDWIYHGDRSGLSVEVSRSLPFLGDRLEEAGQ